MEIELSVKISEEDYVQISIEYNKQTKKSLISWICSVLFWVLITFFLILFITNSLIGSFLDNWFFKITLIVTPLVTIFGIPQWNIYDYKKNYRINENWQQTTQYSINEELIHTKTSFSEIRITWKAIMQMQELAEYFLLKSSTVTF